MGNIVIAIDGPAASGKSTLARNLAEKLNFLHVDSGAFYRAITWGFQEHQVDISWIGAVDEALSHLAFNALAENNRIEISIGGKIVDEELRGAKINSLVSQVATISSVRKLVTRKLHHLADSFNCVIEGRDIGSVVFPSTPYKIYLDAPLHIRASRRQTQGLSDCIASRDETDTQRVNAPLKVTADALHIDVGLLTSVGVLETSLRLLGSRGFSISATPTSKHHML